MEINMAGFNLGIIVLLMLVVMVFFQLIIHNTIETKRFNKLNEQLKKIEEKLNKAEER